mmetsp:Transcript_57694/g.182696  ORF Transcript_57694/g.182696 Transcript_57694/m.182696 type:complete len:250 (-) Transcript_57694:1613-2362(-)
MRKLGTSAGPTPNISLRSRVSGSIHDRAPGRSMKPGPRIITPTPVCAADRTACAGAAHAAKPPSAATPVPPKHWATTSTPPGIAQGQGRAGWMLRMRKARAVRGKGVQEGLPRPTTLNPREARPARGLLLRAPNATPARNPPRCVHARRPKPFAPRGRIERDRTKVPLPEWKLEWCGVWGLESRDAGGVAPECSGNPGGEGVRRVRTKSSRSGSSGTREERCTGSSESGPPAPGRYLPAAGGHRGPSKP